MESTIADPYGTVVWPVTPHPAPVGLQEFGSYRSYYPEGHRGSDYPVGTGTSVVAISNGTVTASTADGGQGNFVDVRHDNGLSTHSIHLSRRDVSVGQRVTSGQQLGLSGNTGEFSAGPHLHIEIFRSGSRIDPHAFFLQYVGPGDDTNTGDELTPEQDQRMKNIENILVKDNGGGLRSVLTDTQSNAYLAAARSGNLEAIVAKDNGGGLRAAITAIRTKLGA